MNAPEPTNRRESSEDRRVAIAMAARALIAEKGIEGLRTRDIADRVGINIATLHYHVPSKEALIHLVAGSIKDDFRAQPIARPRAHLPAVEQLEHEFYDFHEMMIAQPEIFCVLGELAERGRRDPAIRNAIAPMQRHWYGMMANIMAQGRLEGSFRADIDPEPAAAMIIGALLMFRRTVDYSPDKYEQLCAELRRAVRNPSSNQD